MGIRAQWVRPRTKTARGSNYNMERHNILHENFPPASRRGLAYGHSLHLDTGRVPRFLLSPVSRWLHFLFSLHLFDFALIILCHFLTEEQALMRRKGRRWSGRAFPYEEDGKA